MRCNANLLLLALSLCVPVFAQNDAAKQNRLGLAKHITAPTVYFGSIRSKDAIEAVTSSKFWQRPLIRKGLAMIPPAVAKPIAMVLAQTSDEFGIWVPETSVEPFARLVGLLPDVGAGAIAWLADDMDAFGSNKARQQRVLNALEKGILPTIVLFNKTAHAAELTDAALGALTPDVLPPGIKLETKKEGLTHLGIVRLPVKMMLPGPARQLVQGLPLLGKLSEEDQARAAKALESMTAVIAFGRIGDYVVASVGPDVKALAALDAGLKTPPAFATSLAGSPMFFNIRKNMTPRTFSFTTGDARTARVAILRECVPSLKDLENDFTRVAAGQAGAAAAAIAMYRPLVTGLRASLEAPEATDGLRQAVTLVDRGLRTIDHVGLAQPLESAKGGGAMADLLPKETLLGGVSVIDHEVQDASVAAVIEGLAGLQSLIKDYAWPLMGAKEMKRVDPVFATANAILGRFRTRVIPALGRWSAYAVTASGQLNVPEEFSVPIPEIAIAIQLRDTDAFADWWTFARDEVLTTLNKLAPGEEITLPEPTEWTHKGVTMRGYDVGALTGEFTGDVVFHACVVNRTLIASTSLRLTKRMIDLAQAEAAGETIRDRPHYKTMADELYTRKAFETMMFLDLGGWVQYAKTITNVILKKDANNGKVDKDDQQLVDDIFDVLSVLGAVGDVTSVKGTTETTVTWLLLDDK